ncbi:MAG: tRNA (adenosine(37)-N6)-dimethylallyltransferase MiaA [Oleiphilaceae bacterium]|nr:tRNA (adenosine(37)-N6)-dimethylallyltransferase MiaA [Oleiphilaceae bacterium]
MTHINPETDNKPVVTILGPTASGKTRLAVALAEHFNGEVISADSRQVYRGMDIGTGKDLLEYGQIPYHLIDIVNPGYEYNLFEFCQDTINSLSRIWHRGALPIVAGGTGLYVDALISRYQLSNAERNEQLRKDLEQKSDEELVRMLFALKPDQHNTTDLLDRNRLVRAIEIAQAEQNSAQKLVWPPFRTINLGINIDRNTCRRRITERLKQRFKQGMIEEVETLHRQGLTWQQLDFYGLEYRYIALYLQNKLNYNDMFQKLNAAIHTFAKQQYKWFRKMEDKGVRIQWIDFGNKLEEHAIQAVRDTL